MLFKHHALNRLLFIVGIASLSMAAHEGGMLSRMHRHLPDTGAGIASGHIVNRMLKADKLMLDKPQAVEPETPQVPRSDKRGLDIKIGCERPFSIMVRSEANVARRCIASTDRLHSTDA